MAFVYWIHLPEHTDITTYGYIGFTSKTVEGRFKKHRQDSFQKNKRNYTLHHAIRKYDTQLQVTTLVEGSEEYCLMIEEKLRPHDSIGWNQARGGSKPPSLKGTPLRKDLAEKLKAHNTGRPKSEEAKRNISESKKRFYQENPLTEAQKAVKRESLAAFFRDNPKGSAARKAMSQKSRMWNHHSASNIWLYCEEIFQLFLNKTTVTKIPKLLNVEIPRTPLYSLYRKFRDGWVPSEDQEYLSWLKERKSDES